MNCSFYKIIYRLVFVMSCGLLIQACSSNNIAAAETPLLPPTSTKTSTVFPTATIIPTKTFTPVPTPTSLPDYIQSLPNNLQVSDIQDYEYNGKLTKVIINDVGNVLWIYLLDEINSAKGSWVKNYALYCPFADQDVQYPEKITLENIKTALIEGTNIPETPQDFNNPIIQSVLDNGNKFLSSIGYDSGGGCIDNCAKAKLAIVGMIDDYPVCKMYAEGIDGQLIGWQFFKDNTSSTGYKAASEPLLPVKIYSADDIKIASLAELGIAPDRTTEWVNIQDLYLLVEIRNGNPVKWFNPIAGRFELLDGAVDWFIKAGEPRTLIDAANEAAQDCYPLLSQFNGEYSSSDIELIGAYTDLVRNFVRDYLNIPISTPFMGQGLRHDMRCQGFAFSSDPKIYVYKDLSGTFVVIPLTGPIFVIPPN